MKIIETFKKKIAQTIEIRTVHLHVVVNLQTKEVMFVYCLVKSTKQTTKTQKIEIGNKVDTRDLIFFSSLLKALLAYRSADDRYYNSLVKACLGQSIKRRCFDITTRTVDRQSRAPLMMMTFIVSTVCNASSRTIYNENPRSMQVGKCICFSH